VTVDPLLKHTFDVYQKHNQNAAAAARELGIARSTLQKRVKKLLPKKRDRRHMVIPDTQVKPGVPTEHLTWAGQYAAKKKPDVIVHLGDHWDMPSLSSYDKGKKSFEGRRYKADIAAGNTGMDALMRPILDEMDRDPNWHPELHFHMGNHEQRIERAIQTSPEFDGIIGYEHFNLDLYNWEVHPFLSVSEVDGICYSHYFTSGTMGRPVSSAQAMVTKRHRSCVMGHVQDTQISFQYDAMGKRITGIFGGAFYQHDEDYLGPQGNVRTWRGIWMLYNVDDGEFTLNNIPLSFLKERFG
jgi:hypothetical protein